MVPDSTLKKKSIVVASHVVREGVKKKELIMGYIKTSENCSDLMTETLSLGQNRKRNMRQPMCDIYPEDKVGSF